MLFRRRFFLMAAMAAAVGLVGPSTSRAGFVMTLTDGSSTATIDLTTGATTGSISYSAAGTSFSHVGNLYQATVNGINFAGYGIGFSTSTSVNPGPAELDLSGISVQRTTASSANALTISISADGFADPPTPGLMSSSFTSFFQPSNSPGTVTWASFLGTTNQLFETSTPWALSGGTNEAGALLFPGAYGQNKAIQVTDALPSYSLTDSLTFTGLGVNTGNVSASLNTVVAPAPPGLVLAATAVPFVGLLRRRLKKAVPVA